MSFRKQLNFWGAIVFGTLVVVGGGNELYKTYGGNQGPVRAETAKSTLKQSKLSRNEFKKIVSGNTKDGVMKALGRPSSTMNMGGADVWIYDEATIDEVTNASDRLAQIMFNGDLVMNVSFL